MANGEDLVKKYRKKYQTQWPTTDINTEMPVGEPGLPRTTLPFFNDQTGSWQQGSDVGINKPAAGNIAEANAPTIGNFPVPTGVSRNWAEPFRQYGEQGLFERQQDNFPPLKERLMKAPIPEPTGGPVKYPKGVQPFMDYYGEQKQHNKYIENLSPEQVREHLGLIDQGLVKTTPDFHQALLDRWQSQTKSAFGDRGMGAIPNMGTPPSGSGWLYDQGAGKTYTLGSVPQQSQGNNQQQALQQWVDWANQKRNAGTFGRSDGDTLNHAIASILGVQSAPSEIGLRGAQTAAYRREAMQPFPIQHGTETVYATPNPNTGEYIPISRGPTAGLALAESRMNPQEQMDKMLIQSYFTNPMSAYDSEGKPIYDIAALLRKYGYTMPGLTK
jgi:hypothetical protein